MAKTPPSRWYRLLSCVVCLVFFSAAACLAWAWTRSDPAKAIGAAVSASPATALRLVIEVEPSFAIVGLLWDFELQVSEGLFALASDSCGAATTLAPSNVPHDERFPRSAPAEHANVGATINYPTGPRGTERLRLRPTPLHSDADAVVKPSEGTSEGRREFPPGQNFSGTKAYHRLAAWRLRRPLRGVRPRISHRIDVCSQLQAMLSKHSGAQLALCHEQGRPRSRRARLRARRRTTTWKEVDTASQCIDALRTARSSYVRSNCCGALLPSQAEGGRACWWGRRLDARMPN